MKMGPREAADVIRVTLGADDASALRADFEHSMAYVRQVMSYLGLEDTPLNCTRVYLTLRHHGVELPAHQPYPKWVKRADGATTIVHSAEAAQEFFDELAGAAEYVPPQTAAEAIQRMADDVDPEGTARMNWPHLFIVRDPQQPEPPPTPNPVFTDPPASPDADK